MTGGRSAEEYGSHGRAPPPPRAAPDSSVTLFLCGDVMLGRGVDQILPDSCPPALLEPYVDSALDYVKLAERAHGPIPRRVDYDYVWGVARDILDAEQPDVRIVNLETSVTTSDDAEPKGINYRMHPRNVGVLSAARIDCCVLANNHVLDWGSRGLLQTLETLRAAGIHVTGAGEDLERASAPCIIPLADGRRVVIVGLGAFDSGIPPQWAARSDRPGVNWLAELSQESVARVQQLVSTAKRQGDIAVASIHWGPNWGYEIPRDHRNFAHALIDDAAIDVVHGHSSHHPKAVELYRGHPILYGCGDLITDYEGISGYEGYRGDLSLMYFVGLDTAGTLSRLVAYLVQVRRFRLSQPSLEDREWLANRMNAECGRFGHRLTLEDDRLQLQW